MDDFPTDNLLSIVENMHQNRAQEDILQCGNSL